MTASFFDWFSGIGGFRLAFESAGWRCAGACEIDPFCRRVYAARWGHEPELSDIRSVTADAVPDAELWTFGFPCQDVSVAGKRRGFREVNRSGLVFRLLDLAAVRRPRWALAENVPGLLSVHGGADFGLLLARMADLWPAVGWRVLDAQYFGVAQHRRRVFIVCGLGAGRVTEVLFELAGGSRNTSEGGQEEKITAGELARCVGAVGGGNDYGAGKGTLVIHEHQSSVSLNGKFGALRAGTPGYLSGNLLFSGEDIVRQAVSAKWAKGYSGPAGDEHHNLVVATTLTASPAGDEHHNLVVATTLTASSVVRRLTPSECERAQGFPDGWTCLCGVRPDCPQRRIPPWVDPSTFSLGGCGHSACGCTCPDTPRYRALGNAVAVSVVRWIADRFFEVLRGANA